MSADWNLHRYAGRDYVDLREIAAFYHLPPFESVDKSRLRSTGDDQQMEVQRDRREIKISGVIHWLSFPVMVKDDRWLVSRLDLGKTIDPALRPEKIANLAPFQTVILDPGHGGSDQGAYSPSAWEKEFTLDMVRRIRPLLTEAGLKVIQTRNSDVAVPLEKRATIANRAKNAIFVSIHFNASETNRAATGFEIFSVTPRGAPSTEYEHLHTRDMVEEKGNPTDLASLALATTIYHSMQGHVVMPDRGVKRARFAVLRLSQIPAVLIEGGFLSNPSDLSKIVSRSWRDQLAQSIAQGILEYHRLTNLHIRPRTVAQYKKAAKSKESTLTLKDIPVEKK